MARTLLNLLQKYDKNKIVKIIKRIYDIISKFKISNCSEGDKTNKGKCKNIKLIKIKKQTKY